MFTKQFNTILNYFKIIDKAPTENILPTHHAVNLTNVLREDVIKTSLPKEKVLKNAAKKEDGYFKVSRIM